MPAPTWTVPAYPPGTSPPTSGSPSVSLTSQGAAASAGFVTGSTIDVPSGTTISSATPLTLVSDGSITIDGEIDAPSLTLVRLNKDVILTVDGVLSCPRPSSTAPLIVQAPDAAGSGANGDSGGGVTVLAIKGAIRIEGRIQTADGADGQDVIADGMFTGRLARTGSASATGGAGGAGGDVGLAALDSIGVSGRIYCGTGGDGGGATARATCENPADAAGGPGNGGGNVQFHGFGRVQVFLPGIVRAGDGGHGGRADASGGDGAPGPWPGGDALAKAGWGGPGGTVLFDSACIVMAPGAPQAGMGGDGGVALSRGGDGANGRLYWWGARHGGDAESRGGGGGPPGATPQQPTSGGPQPGVAAQYSGSASAKGGFAIATAGAGGRSFWLSTPADSGVATAQGGPSAIPGSSAPQSLVAGPVAAGPVSVTASGGH